MSRGAESTLVHTKAVSRLLFLMTPTAVETATAALPSEDVGKGLSGGPAGGGGPNAGAATNRSALGGVAVMGLGLASRGEEGLWGLLFRTGRGAQGGDVRRGCSSNGECANLTSWLHG